MVMSKEHFLEINLTQYVPPLSSANLQEHLNDCHLDCVQTWMAEKNVHRHCDFHSEVSSKVTGECA